MVSQRPTVGLGEEGSPALGQPRAGEEVLQVGGFDRVTVQEKEREATLLPRGHRRATGSYCRSRRA